MDSHIDIKSTSALCFNKDDFMSDEFSVDRFVSNCRRYTSLETMREHLNMYHKILCAAMVELINKDYVDLVNLSSNLVGLDKSIKNLSLPLQGLKNELDTIKGGLDNTLNFATSLFDQRAFNHASKVSVYHIVCVLEGLEKIADLNAASENDLEPLQLERIAFSFNSVKFHMQKVANVKDLAHKEEEVQLIAKNLDERLQKVFLQSLVAGDEQNLNKILRIYSLISKEKKAENCFRKEVVRPFMKKVVTQHNVTKLGLDKVYKDILDFIPKHCNEILNITQKSRRRSEVISGFDFLVNGVWQEFIDQLGYISTVHLYSVGDPQLFHQNYSASIMFLDKFELVCGDQGSVRRLRSCTSYKEFISKWNLDVYFQIRFQEIAGEFEMSLLESFAKSKDQNSCFALNATQSLWQCLNRSWSGGIFLMPLKHQFWRLTLQLLSRYKEWAIASIKLDSDASQVAFLIKDVHQLISQVTKFFKEIIHPKISCNAEVDLQLEGVFNETVQLLEVVPERAGKCIVKILMEKCTSHLKWIASIPQRFRKTNRELPSKPSPYVSQVLSPLTEFSQRVKAVLPKDWIEKCEQEVIDGIMSQCTTQMSDVLTSIKKMEDSLKILKRARDKPAGQSTSGVVSDDDKIRRQLAIDVNYFEELILKSGLQGNGGKSLKELKTLVTSAERVSGGNQNT